MSINTCFQARHCSRVRGGVAIVTLVLGLGCGTPVGAQGVEGAAQATRGNLREMMAAWRQVEHMMVRIAEGIEAQYPGYQANMVQFQSHLRSCTPMQWHDPVHGLTRTIRGWQNQRCQVDVEPVDTAAIRGWGR